MLREGLKKCLTFMTTAPNHYKNVYASSAELQRVTVSKIFQSFTPNEEPIGF